MSEIPLCENDNIPMKPFTDAESGKEGWFCPDCGNEFLEEERNV